MLIKELWLIGIGTGSEKHLTLEGCEAIRQVPFVLIPNKGKDKAALIELRMKILDACRFNGEIILFDYPVRDSRLPYDERVKLWHQEISKQWKAAVSGVQGEGKVALLVWGDPSLYDSTIRIAKYLVPPPCLHVIPGITAIQALTAAHKITLNSLAGSVKITTGRRLKNEGWPDDVDTVVVMLDGETGFIEHNKQDLKIWWGAYLGSTEQVIFHGNLPINSKLIISKRHELRARNGWIMDTYLMRRT
ncbi:MAG: precorrin-6A synthase (deacetylating) [Aestuariivita sp.]|nr:precorrin-6A synthase (deacetylating) [Aestuariivita sp.]